MSYDLDLSRRWSALVAVAFAMTVSVDASAAQNFIEYEVQKGDTCIAIARKIYGDGDLCYDLINAHNDFDKKFRVYPGQVLRLPTKEQLESSKAEREKAKVGRPDARLARRRGDVRARAPEAGDWKKASRGQDLWRRWRVDSGDQSSAEVMFLREKARLRMRENTLVVIYGESKKDDGSARHAMLEKGALATRLGELAGGPVRVETPSAIASSGGGDGLVKVLEGGTTIVANHTGKKVSVSGKKKTSKPVELPPNTGSKVEKGKEPTPPKPLPSPPEWGVDSLEVLSMLAASSVLVQWREVKDAAVWRLELRSASTREIVDVIVVDAKVLSTAFENLVPDTYELRASTIDTDGFESKPSEPLEIIVRDVEIASSGAASKDAILIGSSVSLPGMTCRVSADDEFVEHVVLSEAGEKTLECKGENGVVAVPAKLAVEPVTAEISAPSNEMGISAREELEITLDHAVEKIAVTIPSGFYLAQAPTSSDGGKSWIVKVLAMQKGARGEAIVTLGDEGGLELARAPLVAVREVEGVADSGGEEEDEAARARELRRGLIEVGLMVGYRGVFGETLPLYGLEYDASWRTGLRVGYEVASLWFVEGELDYSKSRHSETSLGTTQDIVGWRVAGLRQFGEGQFKPFARLGLGGESTFSPGYTAWGGHLGAGVKWEFTEMFGLRLDLQEHMIATRDDGLRFSTYGAFGVTARF